MSIVRRATWLLASGLLAASMAGCGGDEVETQYGWSRDRSINGVSTLAQMMADRGYAIRRASRYNDTLGDWASVIVRFSFDSGPPPEDEAQWLGNWLRSGPDRKVIFVSHDFRADREFWSKMLEVMPAGTSADRRKVIEDHKAASTDWDLTLPGHPGRVADADDWYATEPSPKPEPPPSKPDPKATEAERAAAARRAIAAATKLKPRWVESSNLGGPWAEGVDAASARLGYREWLVDANDETVLLAADRKPIVMSWGMGSDENNGVLAVANGSFLLNAALLNRQRRPIAERVVDWCDPRVDPDSIEGLPGPDRGTAPPRPVRVAFVQGYRLFPLTEAEDPSPLRLLTVEPFNWIAAQFALFGAAMALAIGKGLGRPRPEPPAETERASAHPEALGLILSRLGGRAEPAARDLIAAYRQWRQPRAHQPHRPGGGTGKAGR